MRINKARRVIRSALLIAALMGLTACARHIPSHLELNASPSEAVESTSPQTAFERLVQNDPWARYLSDAARQRLITRTPEQAKREVEEALLAIESRKVSAGRALSRLERTWSTTAVPALLRGYRMQLTQAQWGPSEDGDLRRYTQAVSLLTGLHESRPPEQGARSSWGWIRNAPPPDVLPYAYLDRWLLRAWQADPSLPLQHLSEPLISGTRQRLAATPEGALLLARGQAPEACKQTVPDAWASLILATDLALQRAAADRDHEQAIWSDRRRATQHELGIDGDPVAHLLETSHSRLTQCAADDRAAGGALLANAAIRWTQGCTKGCDGLDRTFSMTQAGRWHDDAAQLASIWLVIATKESIDTMEVARSTVMFRAAADDLLDLLMTLSPGGVDSYPLYVQSPNATFWNRLGQALTEDKITSWAELKAALCVILSKQAGEARGLASEDFFGPLTQLEERSHLTCPQ